VAGAGLHYRGPCSQLGLAGGRCSPGESKTEKFPFLAPLSRSAQALIPAQLHISPGGCGAWRVLHQPLCPGTMKTDFGFPE